MKTISKIKNIIPSIKLRASLVSRNLGHVYKNGEMYAKHIVALGLEYIFRCSDRELPDELHDRNLLKVLGYKKPPDHSVYSMVRKEIGEEKIGRIAELLIQELYRSRTISMIVVDSTFMSYYFADDKDAAFGYATLKKKEQELLKEKTQKGIKKGYKLHLIYDVETGIPLYWIVLPANIHDKDAFKTLFDYVRMHFRFAHNAKFLADSAYDSRDVRFTLMENGIIPVIAVNGRGHYKSSKPKDPDYGRRGAIERFFSLLKMKMNLLYVRFSGIQGVTAHASTSIFAYLLKYIF